MGQPFKDEKCGSCHYYRPPPPGVLFKKIIPGCLRGRPEVAKLDNSARWHAPSPDDWCGEWRAVEGYPPLRRTDN